MKRRSSKGFTLVELIVVIAILAVLALILVPIITNYIDIAHESKNITNMRMFFSGVVWLGMAEDRVREAIWLRLIVDKVQLDRELEEVRNIPKL